MNKKGFILVVGIIAIIILLFTRRGEAPSTIIDDEVSIGKIKVAHIFMDGIHTFTGEINLPTPCHTLTHKIVIAESYPEQVTAVFEMKSETDTCVQMVMPEPFVVSFEASEEADFRITLNDKDVPFEVVEVQVPEDETDSFLPASGDEKENATSTEEDTVVEKADLYFCAQDSDCVSVKNDCCGCTAGGSATAINKNFESEWREKLNCEEIMCPAVMSSHPSCFQEPKCVENKCLLVDTIE